MAERDRAAIEELVRRVLLEKLGGKARPRWLEDDGGFQR